MDSPTQALLGATVAQLGFRQRIGRDATWVAALAAYSPDLDSFVTPVARLFGGANGPFPHLLYHRGLSHSLLMAPVIAAVFALPWWLIRRRWARRKSGAAPRAPGPGLLFLCTLAAVLTHPLLDWCTSYGTQLFAPLTSRRYAADAVAIIDIIYTPLLVLTLLACYGVRKLRGGAAPRATLAIGLAGVMLGTGYLGLGRLLHDRAIDKALAFHEGSRVVAAHAYPTIGAVFLWRVVLETEDAWVVSRVHHFADSERPPETAVAPKAKTNGWVRRARQTEEYRIYDWFAMGRLRPVYSRTDNGYVVIVHDMRYAWDPAGVKSLWPLRFTFDASGPLRSVKRLHPGRDVDLREMVSRIWSETWTP